MQASRLPFRRRSRALAACAAVALSLLAFGAVGASADATLTVNSNEDFSGGACVSGGPCSLRSAIGDVNDGDVSGEVTIKLNGSGTIATGANGPIAIDPASGVSSLKISGPEAGGLTVSGGNQARVFEVLGGEVAISGLTVAEGAVDGFTFGSAGGAGLLQEAGELTLDQMTFEGNEVDSARHGGALSIEGGETTITDSTFKGNVAAGEHFDAKGGAIFEDTEATALLLIEGSTFVDNHSSGDGGAIFQDEGDLQVEGTELAENEAAALGGAVRAEADGAAATWIAGSRLLHNTAGRGGAVAARNGVGGVTVVRSLLAHNTSRADGGAVVGEGKLTIRDSALVENATIIPEPGLEVSRGQGSAVYVEFDSTTIETSTVAMNDGVAIFVLADTAIRNSTIALNTESQEHMSLAGGIGGGVETEVEVTSSIVAYNSGPTEAGRGCAIVVDSGGHNLVSEGEPVETDLYNPKCEWDGPGDQTETDPLLGALAENDGPTPTLAPTSRLSPAINHGAEPGEFDQRGKTRPVPSGDENTDVGAFEVQAPVAEVDPSISPVAELKVGDVLTCDPGEWDTDGVLDAEGTTEWLRAGTKVDEGETHELEADDVGEPLVCRYSLDNGATATAAESNPVEIEPGGVELAPALLPFGQRGTEAGPSAPQLLTLSNPGGVAATIGSILSEDGQFPIDAGDCPAPGEELEPLAECTIEVRFDPTTTGAQKSTIVVASDAGSASAEATGTGIAAEPLLAASPPEVEFAPRQVGSGASAPTPVTFTAEAEVPITIGQVTVAGPGAAAFALTAGDTCSGATLQPGASCSLAVSFAPPAATPWGAHLSLPGSAPATVALHGLGTAAPPVPAPPRPPQGRLALNGKPLLGDAAGEVPVPLACESPTGAPCQLALVLQGSGGTRLGQWQGAVAAGRKATVGLELSKAGRRSLDEDGTVRARALLSTAGGQEASAPVQVSAPPAPTIEVTGVRRLGNTLALTVTCRSFEPRCQGRISATPAAAAGPVLAADRVSVGAGMETVRVAMMKAGRRLLSHGRHQLLLKALVADGVYDRTTTSRARLTFSAAG